MMRACSPLLHLAAGKATHGRLKRYQEAAARLIVPGAHIGRRRRQRRHTPAVANCGASMLFAGPAASVCGLCEDRRLQGAGSPGPRLVLHPRRCARKPARVCMEREVQPAAVAAHSMAWRNLDKQGMQAGGCLQRLGQPMRWCAVAGQCSQLARHISWVAAMGSMWLQQIPASSFLRS